MSLTARPQIVVASLLSTEAGPILAYLRGREDIGRKFIVRPLRGNELDPSALLILVDGGGGRELSAWRHLACAVIFSPSDSLAILTPQFAKLADDLVAGMVGPMSKIVQKWYNFKFVATPMWADRNRASA